MDQKTFNRYWLIALGVKLLLGAWLPMFSDETYYWVWSKHLQLSYFDHPPFIAWLIWPGQLFESLANTVRWPAIVFSHTALLFWFHLLKGRLEEEKLRPWLLLSLFAPLTGFGSIILTPDLPLMVFWSAALLCMDRAISSKKLSWYVGLGISLGLGFSSKYHMVLFVPMLLIWLSYKRLWPEVNWKGVFLTIVLGLIGSLPVLIWNYQNDWASFTFQLQHGFKPQPWEMKYFWEYVGGQIALIFPTIFFISLKRPKLKSLTWLPIFAWAPLLFFLVSSFKGRVEANWPIIAYPCFIALALFNSTSMRWVRWTVSAWIVTAVVIGTQIIYPWLPLDERKLKTFELKQHDVYAKVAESYRPLYTHTFQLASKLWYETKQPTFKLKGLSRIDFYDSLEGSTPTADSYFFIGEHWNQLPKWAHDRGDKIVNRYKLDQSHTLFEVHAK